MKLRYINEKKLKQKDRDKLPDDDFAVPGKKAYPIPDRSHAANALSRSSGKGVAGRVRKKVCSKYPDMASCDEQYIRYIAAAHNLIEDNGPANWTADLIGEPVIVSQEQADGTIRKLRVTKYRVILKNGPQRLVFKVAKGKDGHPVFTDDREARTGAARSINTGPLPGDEYAKAGPERKLTASGWAEQVERLIGPAGIGKVFVGLIKSGFKAG